MFSFVQITDVFIVRIIIHERLRQRLSVATSQPEVDTRTNHDSHKIINPAVKRPEYDMSDDTG